MRADQVDTLIDQLEDYVRAVINNQLLEIRTRAADIPNQQADGIVLKNMRESLKEYICELLKLKATRQIIDNLKCPDCGSDMIQRRNKQNGDIFYGCRKFPNCKGTRDEDGLSREERNELKDREKVTQQDGFSFKRQPWKESGPTG